MRTYCKLSNLGKAALIGAAVTVMSVPRIMLGGMPVLYYSFSAFVLMTLVAAMATAWGGRYGLAGLFPEKRLLIRGLVLAVGVSAVIVPVQYFWIDPLIRSHLTAAGNSRVLELAFPSTVNGVLALLLWSAGFQALFFTAAPVAFCARLTGVWWSGIIFGSAVKALAGYQQMLTYGIDEAGLLVAAGGAVGSLFGGYLFARFGLAPLVVFSALTELRLFLNI